ncbi:endonuclease/exonuclease/phosphatase family protein [Vagococcus fluvialis]|uniref:endonuclease/exonuclease/phosphatase family protein n=1 Tax=Vagococcus fluvialis TaxID=2738 RepID=UPI003B59191D
MIEYWVGTFNVAAGLQPNKEQLKHWLNQQEIDILGLQEVDEWTKRNPYSMVKHLEEIYSNHYFSKAMSFEEGEYGNAILTRFPILSQDTVSFKEYGLEKRVYQKVLLEIMGKQIALYNIHLSFESPVIRQSQISDLLDELTKETAAYKIILGDFNIDQSLEEWQVFNDYQLINGYQGKWLRTFIEEDGNMNHYSIDNIILSNNIELVAIRNIVTELSDHSLLAAKIRLL